LRPSRKTALKRSFLFHICGDGMLASPVGFQVSKFPFDLKVWFHLLGTIQYTKVERASEYDLKIQEGE
jgi:hypothetical protein